MKDKGDRGEVNKDEHGAESIEQGNEADQARRAALKKLGKSAYAAPVVMTLLASRKASALSPPAPPG